MSSSRDLSITDESSLALSTDISEMSRPLGSDSRGSVSVAMDGIKSTTISGPPARISSPSFGSSLSGCKTVRKNFAYITRWKGLFPLNARIMESLHTRGDSVMSIKGIAGGDCIPAESLLVSVESWNNNQAFKE